MSDYELSYNGLTFGGDTDYGFVSAEGLVDQPDLRTSDRARLRRHGLLPGDDFLAGRSITLELEVFGADAASFQSNMNALKLAFAPGSAEKPLVFQLSGVAGGGVRRVNVRPRKLASRIDAERFLYRMPVAAVQFDATDPRIYDNTESSIATGLTASVPGLTWNLAWNLNWGGPSTSNIITANNIGTFSAPLTVRFDGPVTNPGIENVTTGQALTLSADGGLILAAGEFVILDSESHTVMLGGTSNRYSKLTSTSSWFDLSPGNTSLRFTGTTAGAPTMTVTYRSAWL